MERVVVDRSFTLYKTFYESGVATDPDSPPTVVVTRSDGSTVTTGAVTDETQAGTWSVTVPASSNTLLDLLTATWTAEVNGEDQTYLDYIEVAGRFLFTIAEARALKPLDNTTVYSEAAIVAMRTTVEQALEDACQVAFVPRYTRETITGDGTSRLWLKYPKTRAIRSVTALYRGVTTTLTAGDLTNLTWDGHGGLYGYTWTCGYPWTVGYEHGWDAPPQRISRAALLLAKTWLVSSPVDDRAATFSSADGGTYGLVVEGRAGSTFGIPAVDAAVDQYSLAVGVA